MTDVESVLITIGVILLLVGLIGQVKAKELEVGTKNVLVRIILGLLGLVFIGIALGLIFKLTLQPQITTPTPETPTQETPTILPPTISNTPPPPPTAASNIFIFSFQSCPTRCTGQNSQSDFPEGTKIIYLQWQYQNIPLNAHYVRTTKLGDRTWANYDCFWPNSPSGIEEETLTEPNGLASGDWILTIYVNDELLLNQTIHVEGNWTYFDPAGSFQTCTGKR
jgi:hypothetical protein